MINRNAPFLKGLSITTLYIIYLFDTASTVMVLVVFAPFLIDPQSLFVSASMSVHMRNTLLGFLYAAYPLTQFLGAPLLGELSDRFGKKNILNISTLAAALSYFFTALCILNHNLPLLFLSRLIAGFFAGNASVAQATVSNMIVKKNRSRAMAFFVVLGGVAWIVGPFTGSLLSNSKMVHWFSMATPFWFLGFVFLLCWGLFMLCYESNFIRKPNEKLSITQCYKNVASIFKLKIIVAPFIASTISIFGLMIADTFFSPFLMQKFDFDYVKVGYAFAYFSFWWLLGGFFASFIFKFQRPSKWITMSIIIAAIFIFIYVMDSQPTFIYWAGAIANFCYSISYAGFMALFSHLVPDEMQGKLFGAWAGSFALANTIAPAFAGWISFLGINVPIALGSIFILSAGMIYLSWHQRHLKTLKNYEI